MSSSPACFSSEAIAARTTTSAPRSPLIASSDMVDLNPNVFGSRRQGAPEWGSLFFVVDFVLHDNLLATVKTVRRNTMPQVGLPGRRIDRQCRVLQFVVRAAFTATRRCPATLLNSHYILLFGTAHLRRLSILDRQEPATTCFRRAATSGRQMAWSSQPHHPTNYRISCTRPGPREPQQTASP